MACCNNGAKERLAADRRSSRREQMAVMETALGSSLSHSNIVQVGSLARQFATLHWSLVFVYGVCCMARLAAIFEVTLNGVFESSKESMGC
jgi:hypothetical protein